MRNDSLLSQNIPDILIVDDTPANLMLLSQILKDNGYKVRPVLNGILALQVAEKEKPDLILLDIMMPDMDGFEVCCRLKKNPNLKDVPVIFISALNSTEDIVKALTSGGADYISKPFQTEEVLARVNTHLQIYQQRKELQELNATKDKFFSIIAHDLRGPLGGFMRLTEMMADESISFTPDEKKELILNLSLSARNIFNLLDNLLEWSKMKRGITTFSPQILDLNKIITECLKIVADSVRKKAIEIAVDIPENNEVFADTNMLQTVIRNLVSNAIKFTHREGKVTISAGTDVNNATVIAIKDTGIGLSSIMTDNLFHIDINTNRPGTEGELSTGLGLLLCKEFVEKHGGRIGVESEEGKGSTFYFTIPYKEKE
ncbi:MAG: hybrid sensor histidine kinase/response regulator [Bacteroidota bacterium]